MPTPDISGAIANDGFIVFSSDAKKCQQAFLALLPGRAKNNANI